MNLWVWLTVSEVRVEDWQGCLVFGGELGVSGLCTWSILIIRSVIILVARFFNDCDGKGWICQRLGLESI